MDNIKQLITDLKPQATDDKPTIQYVLGLLENLVNEKASVQDTENKLASQVMGITLHPMVAVNEGRTEVLSIANKALQAVRLLKAN